VTREDVERFASAPAGRSFAGAAEADERIPFRGLRRRIAEAMVASKSNIPHFTYVEEVDVTELKRFREASREEGERLGVKMTYLPYIIKALVRGFREYPQLNAVLDEEKGEIVLRKEYHIGIAAATPQGLIVPVVRNCESRSMAEIAAEVERIAADAKGGKSKLEDVQGSTFTITNLGPLGGILATPIINYPEVAILGVHKIRTVPKWEDGSWVPRDVMNLSLSLDHRVVDGADGAEFLQYVIRYLENPWLLLVESI
jgi:pyruvate dehydrogenase E2 component (dihydrolipoamide acetyltransferase)